MYFRNENLEGLYKYCTVEKNHCIACGSRVFKPWASAGEYQAVKCESCGLIWMNPFLNDAGLFEYYRDYIGRRRLGDDLKMCQRMAQYQSDRAFIEHYIGYGRLLDVGCNGGFFLSALSSNFEKHGIEIDPEAVSYARRTHGDFGDNILNVSLNDIPYEEASFDLITMRGTIEHLPDPVEAISKVAGLLREGGFFFISATPNGDSFAAALFREKWSLFHPIQHIWHFSPRTLDLICLRFGFKLIAKDFPYLGTPYENVLEDIRHVMEAINMKRDMPGAELAISPPFWESMMSLVFKKVTTTADASKQGHPTPSWPS